MLLLVPDSGGQRSQMGIGDTLISLPLTKNVPNLQSVLREMIACGALAFMLTLVIKPSNDRSGNGFLRFVPI